MFAGIAELVPAVAAEVAEPRSWEISEVLVDIVCLVMGYALRCCGYQD